MSASFNYVPLSSKLATVQTPKMYQQFPSRERAIQTMTGPTSNNVVPNNTPILLIYSPNNVKGTNIDSAVVAVVLFLDQAR